MRGSTLYFFLIWRWSLSWQNNLDKKRSAEPGLFYFLLLCLFVQEEGKRAFSVKRDDKERIKLFSGRFFK